MPSFAGLLNEYAQRLGYTPSQLARLSGLPRMTLVNWLEGQAKNPRHWQDVLRLAQALRLNQKEADELLQAAGFPAISQLSDQAQKESNREMLGAWLVNESKPGEQPPFQAIRDLPTFVGREGMIATIQEKLVAGNNNNLFVLEGPAGIGKTVLAARLAYRLRPVFSDGVLWVRLDKTSPMSALQLFAAAYGRDVTMFDDLESRSAAVRSLLAIKRVLIVLDYAQDRQAIEPLLPPSGACAVVITTRNPFLATNLSAERFLVEPFTTDETRALFATILGEEVVHQEWADLQRIASLLGFLPLALDIVASRLAYEPGWKAAAFLARLREKQNNLDELVIGERSVRMALETIFALLPLAQQRFFTVLAVFNGADFDALSAAAAANTTVENAAQYLQEFLKLSLVRRGRQNHYRLIPVLQSFASEKAANNPSGFT